MLVLLCAFAPGCQPLSAAPPSPNAAEKASKVTGAKKETDLAKVEVNEDAEKRLGITKHGGLIAGERKAVPMAVSYPGDKQIPSGQLISVTSPFAATLKAPVGISVPQPGAIVTLCQVIFLIEPNLSPGERATLASV
jgi:membrane fusion protein, heavy metal efflux system